MVPVKSFMVPIEKIIAVDRGISVRQAAEIMKDTGIGSVFVTRDRVIIGILTDTDICRRLVGMGLDSGTDARRTRHVNARVEN